MPNCSVISCRARSYARCFEKNGLGFYRFPRKSHLKEKWIEVTGRKKDWFPSKNSRICSKHFVEDDFLVTACKTRKLLRSDAVPHIDVCRLVQNDKSDNATSKKRLKVLQNKSNDDEDHSSSEENEDNERISPSLSGESKQQLKRIINTKSDIIIRQRSKIRALRMQNRRFKAKIEKMEEVLNDLQKEMLMWLPE